MTVVDSWDPEQYNRYAEYRCPPTPTTRPISSPLEVAAEMLDSAPPDTVARNVLRPEEYAVLLDELGCTEQHVRLQVYAHHLASSNDVVEWVKGTSLTRFKEPLGPERWDEFVDRYRARLLGVIGDRAPYLYPFKRILLWRRRG